jgi:hypothetical protein
VIWLALPLVMAVACTLLVAVAPSWPAAGVLLIAGRSAEGDEHAADLLR